MSLYDELGVAKDASIEQIKSAYRRRSRDTHPDHGGDAEQFKALAVAYRVLSDQERRARYDRGETPESITAAPRTEDQQAQEILAKMLAEMVAKDVDMKHRDLVDLMRKNLQEGIRTFTAQSKAHRDKSAKCRDALKRISGGEEETCPIRGSLNAQIAGLDHAATQGEEQARIGQKAIEFLKAYSYDADNKATLIVNGKTLSGCYITINDGPTG